MIIKCGIIGLPNVGKSSLFKNLTDIKVRAENFPFCTIDPNIGFSSIPDDRIDQLAKVLGPKRIVYSKIQFIDVAGLVPGSSKGIGLGNRFLSEIRRAKIILHLVRCFENEKIIHILNRICPIKDIEIVNSELIRSDINLCKKLIFNLRNNKSIAQEEQMKEKGILERSLFQLKKFGTVRSIDLNMIEKSRLEKFGFLTAKPVIYVLNIHGNSSISSWHLKEIQSLSRGDKNTIISLHEDYSPNINSFEDNIQFSKSKLKELIHSICKVLNMITFFTINSEEIRAWIVKHGTTALEASSKIHSSFEKRFIRVKVISFSDFVRYKEEKKIKKLGRIRYEGKKYIIQDGEILQFLLQKK